jgi:hypothetical protein
MRRSCRGMDADDCDAVSKTLWKVISTYAIGRQTAEFAAAR